MVFPNYSKNVVYSLKPFLAVEYFCKMHHFRCFNMLWIGPYSRAIPKSININKAIGKRLKFIKWTGPTKIRNDVRKASTIIKKTVKKCLYAELNMYLSPFSLVSELQFLDNTNFLTYNDQNSQWHFMKKSQSRNLKKPVENMTNCILFWVPALTKNVFLSLLLEREGTLKCCCVCRPPCRKA